MKLTPCLASVLAVSISLPITNTQALSPNKEPLKIKFIKKPTRLAAKSFAVKRFGREIKILSNRFFKKSGCYKIVIKTKSGNIEVLRICKKQLSQSIPNQSLN